MREIISQTDQLPTDQGYGILKSILLSIMEERARRSEAQPKKKKRVASVSTTPNETPKEEKEQKQKFRDFVYLTQKEYENLINDFGEKQTKEMIERLNTYIGSSGKQYKSHYFTILTRARKDGKETGKNEEIERLKQEDRERRLREAQKVLDSNKNTNATTSNSGNFNRRTAVGS